MQAPHGTPSEAIRPSGLFLPEAREALPLAGFSLVSAVGSLPLHLTPILVTALVTSSLVSIVEAGWITGGIFIGQLTASFVLPSLGITAFRRPHLAAVSALLIAALLSADLGPATLFVGWFVVGLCCGTFQYIGILTAAEYPNPHLALTLRLGIVLVLAGSTIALLETVGAVAFYSRLILTLSLAFGLVLFLSVPLCRPVSNSPAASSPPESGALAGLATLLILFIGQTGFLAYVIHNAGVRGLSLEQATWVFAAIKTINGLVLISLLCLRDNRLRFLPLGLTLCVCALTTSLTHDIQVFFFSLLIFDTAFCLLSTRVQAHVVVTSPRYVRRWMTLTILLGAGLGPPLHGLFIEAAVGYWFIAFAMVSALVPYLWVRTASRVRLPGETPAGAVG